MPRIFLLILVVFLTPGCARKPPTVPCNLPGLHNVLRVSDNLFSGSSPEGDAGFASLQRLGIKTIITVDGARPDVETARKYGIRYVHIPIGYDGVPRKQALRIARAVRDLPGPVYLHCHHGKHRGPAAAVVARLCLDEKCPNADAVAFLKLAGTAPRYKGLYDSVEHFERLSTDELDALPADFPEVAKVSSLVKFMVEMDNRWDHLSQVQAAGWKPPKDHPDIDPAHEATLLWELYREAARLPEVMEKPESFRRWLSEGEHSARSLAAALGQKTKMVDPIAARLAFDAQSKACAGCHARYRDVPRP